MPLIVIQQSIEAFRGNFTFQFNHKFSAQPLLELSTVTNVKQCQLLKTKHLNFIFLKPKSEEGKLSPLCSPNLKSETEQSLSSPKLGIH